MKKKGLTIFVTLFLLALSLVIFKPNLTGFIIHEPISETNDVNLTIENNTFVVGTNFTLTLYQINNNWSNYTAINVSVTGVETVLLSQEHYDISTFIDYSDVSWNFSANQVGIANINISLTNTTLDIISYELQLNIVPAIDTSPISLNVPEQQILNGEDFSINVTNSLNDWSDFLLLTIYYDNQTILPTSAITTSTSVLTAPFEINFTTISNKIANITLEITDINGQKTNITKNVTIYNNSCPEPSYFSCSDGSTNNPTFDNCTYEFITQLYQDRIRFYFNGSLAMDGVSNYSMIYNFDGLTASKYTGSHNNPLKTYDAISNIGNISMRKYNITALLISSSNYVCKHSETLDLTDPYAEITLEPVFNGLPFCENLVGLRINDTNLTNGNFTGLNNITISSLDGLINETEINTFNNTGNQSTIYFDNISCNQRRSHDISLTYNGTILRTKTINLYNPSCEDINIYNENDQIKVNYTNTFAASYWDGFKSFDYFLYSQDARNDLTTKNLSNLNQIYMLNTTLNYFNNETREVTYFLNATFNFTETYYDAYCINPFNFTKNETADPNITLVWDTRNFENKDIDVPFQFYVNVTNHAKNNLSFNITFEKINLNTSSMEEICKISLNFTESNNTYRISCNTNFSADFSYTINSTVIYFKQNDDQVYTIGMNDFWVKELEKALDVPQTTFTKDEKNYGSPVSGSITGGTLPSQSTSPKPVIIEQPLFIDPRLSGFLSNKLNFTTTYAYGRGTTVITHTLKNTNILPITDIKLYVVIPKYVAKNASEIKGEFIINESDPVILFNVKEIRPGRKVELEYSFNRTINASLLSNITIYIETRINESLLNETLKKIEDTNNATNITIDITKEGNQTSFSANIETLNSTLKNVTIYVEIPKCLAQYLKDLEFENKDYEVIRDDPLIAWTFAEISDKVDLKFRSIKEIDKDCYEQIKVLPIAEEIERMLLTGNAVKEIDEEEPKLIITDEKSKKEAIFLPIIILVIALVLLPIISKYSKVLEKDEHEGKHFLHKDIIKDLEVGFEEFAFISIILLDVLDFLHLLSPEWDFVAKVVSTLLLSILIYNTNLSSIFFGEKHKFLDIMTIVAYFSFFIKDFLAIAATAQIEIIESGKTNWLLNAYDAILPIRHQINLYAIIFGVTIILLLSLIRANKEVKTPSLMAVLHEEGKPRNIFTIPVRFITLILIYFAFFVIIFNPVIQWLAISVNSTITILILIVYLIIFATKHHEHYSASTMIYKIGNATEEVYEAFLKLISNKKGVFLAVSGMLILHLIVDLGGSYLIPYLVYQTDISYYGSITHQTLIPLLSELFANTTLLDALKLSAIYVLNFVALTIALIIPGFIWYKIYSNKKIEATKFLSALFFASAFVFLTTPVFRMEALTDKGVYIGVDVELIQNVTGLFSTNITLLISLTIFIVIYILSYLKIVDYLFELSGCVTIFGFFAKYSYDYLSSWTSYFKIAILGLFQGNNIIIGVVLTIFFTITVLFYTLGYLIFIYLVLNHWLEKTPAHIETEIRKIEQTKPSEPLVLEEITENTFIQTNNPEEKRQELIQKGIKQELIDQAYMHYKIDQAKRYIETSPDKEKAKQRLIKTGWDKNIIEKL